MDMQDVNNDISAADSVIETATDAGSPSQATADSTATQVVVEEMLVEEISIDGMCGVY